MYVQFYARSVCELKKKVNVSCTVVSDSLWFHGLQPVPLLCPWNSPGKNTGVSYHFLLQEIFLTGGSNWVCCAAGRFFTSWATREAQVKVKVTQLCLTLCDPMHCSPRSSPGQNTGVGGHSLLQGPNPGLPHCRRILYQLSYQGSPECELGRLKSTPYAASYLLLE